MLGLRGWAKRMPIKMTKPTKGMWTQVKFVWVHKAEWWESVWSSRPRETNPICVLVSKGWAKRTPIKFEKPGWEKVNPGQNLFGSTRLSDDSQFGQAGQEKRILYVCWCLEAERNERPFSFLMKLGLGKVKPGQNLFGSTRLSDDIQFGWEDQGKRILFVC